MEDEQKKRGVGKRIFIFIFLILIMALTSMDADNFWKKYDNTTVSPVSLNWSIISQGGYRLLYNNTDGNLNISRIYNLYGEVYLNNTISDSRICTEENALCGNATYSYNYTLATPYEYNLSTAVYDMYNNEWSSTYNATYDFYSHNQTVNGTLWRDYVDNQLATLNPNKSLYLFKDIFFNYNTSFFNYSYYYNIDVNYTFNSTIDTTIGDFSNGTIIYSNLTTQSGNITLNWNSNNLKDTLLLLHFDNNISTIDGINTTDDVSIYNNNGQCYNFTSGTITCPTFNSTGYIGGAFEFDGVNDYIKLSSSATMAGKEQVTISVWIKPNDLSVSDKRIYDEQTSTNAYTRMGIEQDTNTIQLKWRDSPNDPGGTPGTITTSAVLSAGTWTHILIVYDSINNLQKIYIDGTLNVMGTTSISALGTSTTNAIVIGNQNTQNWFNGTIDEVRIYNRSLTSDEIYRDYQAGLKKIQPSLNDYEFNATFTSSVFDLGKTPNMSKISWGHDTPHSSYYYQSGLIFGWDGSNLINYINTSMTGTASGGLLAGNNQSIFPDNNATSFDGVNDEIGFGNPQQLNFENELSISFWMNSYKWHTWNWIVTKNKDSIPGYGYYIAQYGNVLRWGVSGKEGYKLLTITAPTINEWHFITATFKPNDISAIYVDGALKNSVSTASISKINTTSVAFEIGSTNYYDAAGANANFNGTIDEVHIWKRALSQDEIQTMYNISKNKYPISLQTRMGNSDVDFSAWSNWSNSTTAGGYYINYSNQTINTTILNQYFQYRTEFNTLNTNITPVLEWVNFSYYSNTTGIEYINTSTTINQGNDTRLYSVESDLWIETDSYNEMIIIGTGTINYLSKWATDNKLTPSIMYEIADTINVNGNIDITGIYKVNGTEGISKTIQVVNDTDLVTVSYCNMTFISGILTSTNC